ncbi:M23 family metallopeptidase [Alkalihalobacillus sp. BA299]|uniref:M23 family metallopeptidase n=1 Tax=Alkalihalobacillus sp. BA299 TaxID=2815938 RepID=UPI001ADAFE47|nr:M23 family metallopeptidase [Alkalihalobacillus sp. BA299]
MSKRIDKIRKQIESRRREAQGKGARKERSAPLLLDRHDESRDEPDFYIFQEKKESPNDQWQQKDWFLMRSLFAVVVFLVIAIMFNSSLAQLEGAKQVVKQSYEQEFQFATVANWYEKQFGRPLALLPMSMDVALEDTEDTPPVAYAVPATGQIRENFQENGTGILVETEIDANVEAVKSGLVIFVGDEERLGLTVAIQHYDGGQSWYGMLKEVDVKLYDHIEAGKPVGKVSVSEEVGKGIYYLSIKEGEDYIDPNDVISFE